jgi:hypothetical protein
MPARVRAYRITRLGAPGGRKRSLQGRRQRRRREDVVLLQYLVFLIRISLSLRPQRRRPPTFVTTCGSREAGAHEIYALVLQRLVFLTQIPRAWRLVKSLLKNYEHPPAMHIALGWCRYYLSDTWLNLPHTGFEALRASRIFQRQTDGERPTQNIE